MCLTTNPHEQRSESRRRLSGVHLSLKHGTAGGRFSLRFPRVRLILVDVIRTRTLNLIHSAKP